jgi:hypothetical protein
MCLSSTVLPLISSQIERFNQTFQNMLARIQARDPARWVAAVSATIKAYNGVVHRVTRLPPDVAWFVIRGGTAENAVKLGLSPELLEQTVASYDSFSSLKVATMEIIVVHDLSLR